jgi:hypothetical protein
LGIQKCSRDEFSAYFPTLASWRLCGSTLSLAHKKAGLGKAGSNGADEGVFVVVAEWASRQRNLPHGERTKLFIVAGSINTLSQPHK